MPFEILNLVILAVGIFFSLNMGGSSFAASMATACGSGVLSKRKAQMLFVILIVVEVVVLRLEKEQMILMLI